MKELSIEEKARLYDEAIKRAREFVCKNNVEVAEYIFPELSGSEDEKIRKEILSFLRTGNPYSGPNSKRRNKWADWLEKQGEQNPFNYENATIVQKDFAPIEPRYNIGDVLCDKSCTTLNKDAQPNFEIVDIKDGLYICDKGSIPISQQDEYELVAKKIEQKPIDVRTTGYWHVEDVEQKSAWSEEDKKTLERVIRCIENHDYMNVDDIHWLKSLKERVQPQNTWKPSEEQMEALNALNVIGGISYTGQGQVLIELYKDLLKLKA